MGTNMSINQVWLVICQHISMWAVLVQSCMSICEKKFHNLHKIIPALGKENLCRGKSLNLARNAMLGRTVYT